MVLRMQCWVERWPLDTMAVPANRNLDTVNRGQPICIHCHMLPVMYITAFKCITGAHTNTHTRAQTHIYTGVLGFEQACSVWMRC